MANILLVHPYYGLAKFWIQLLRDEGFETDFAGTLADAIKRLKAEKFDLLVIEPVLLPGGEGAPPLDEKFSKYPGLEAMRQIRAKAFAPAGNPGALPIIVWTTITQSGQGYPLALSFKPEMIIDAIHSPGALAQACRDLLGSGEK